MLFYPDFRLVFFRAQGKAVDVDARGGNVGVVLEGLDNVEVLAFALGEPIMAIQLQLSIEHGVLAVVSKVKPLLLSGVVFGLDSPHQLLDGVVEVGLDLDVGIVHALITRELQLVNQIFVAHLSEAAALVGISINTPLFSVFVSPRVALPVTGSRLCLTGSSGAGWAPFPRTVV